MIHGVDLVSIWGEEGNTAAGAAVNVLINLRQEIM